MIIFFIFFTINNVLLRKKRMKIFYGNESTWIRFSMLFSLDAEPR